MTRKITGLLLTGMALCLSASAATTVQSFYFDFGPNNVANRGNITTSPDTNSNYWNNICSNSGNNITANAEFSPLQNSAGTTMPGMKVTVNGQFVTNGLSGGGGLQNPSAELLGDLAISTATEDYMFLDGNNVDNRPFTISGLNPDHAYVFHVFSSRSNNENRTGRFTIEGYNTISCTNQAAGTGIGANGENYNTSNITISEPVFPAADGSIKITVSRVTGQYIPINCMKMVEQSGVEKPDVAEAGRKFYFDFGATPGATNPCDLTESPDGNGNYWNNITNSADGSKYADQGSVYNSIIDSTNGSSTLSITLNDRFSTNGRSGGGGLLSPSAELLGDMAVATATSDYFYYEADQTDCSMTFSGFEADKAYRFYIFASRAATDTRTGLYQLSGHTVWSGTLQAAGSNIGGQGVNQNNSNILVSDYIFADSDGKITLTVKRSAGTYIPLNSMKIVEFSGIERPVVANYTSATLGGSAATSRTTVLNRSTVGDRLVNAFTGVADFAAGTFTITATDENGEVHTFGADNGQLKENGTPITVEGYPTMIEFDLDALTYSLTPIKNIRLIGSAVGSWSLDNYKEMNYDGNLVFSWEGILEGYDTSNDSGRLGLYINGGWTAFKRSAISEDYHALLELNGKDDIPINPGSYKMNFDLATGLLKVENGLSELDNNRITVFGSSVANGQGASQINGDNQGYIRLYGDHLAERYDNGDSNNPFYISNISIGGNSTVMLLNRYDDMRREFGKYVIFGVSLGNEGIHEASNKQATYDQFKSNMLSLIDMVRADGKVPVVCNNYTRGDFTDADYQYILQMDREIGLWDVPSINLLGAIDSKTGLWADGYQNGTDIYHPNQQGHQEFAYAVVPSLFDALESGKPLFMARQTAPGRDVKGATLSIVPEAMMHSFSLVVVGKGNSSQGNIASIQLADGNLIHLNYSENSITASLGDRTLTVNGGFTSASNLVALNYTFASGILDLEVYHGNESAGSARMQNVTIEPTEFKLDKADLHLNEIMLYRSALSSTDVESLASGDLQKGSLEIYSTFSPVTANDATRAITTTEVPNYAMSLNTVKLSEDDHSAIIEIEQPDSSVEITRYYTVEGIEVANPIRGNIYITVNGSETRKIRY